MVPAVSLSSDTEAFLISGVTNTFEADSHLERAK